MKSKLKKIAIALMLFIVVVSTSQIKEAQAQLPGPTPEPGLKQDLPGPFYACICPIYVANSCGCIPERH